MSSQCSCRSRASSTAVLNSCHSLIGSLCVTCVASLSPFGYSQSKVSIATRIASAAEGLCVLIASTYWRSYSTKTLRLAVKLSPPLSSLNWSDGAPPVLRESRLPLMSGCLNTDTLFEKYALEDTRSLIVVFSFLGITPIIPVTSLWDLALHTTMKNAKEVANLVII